MCGLLRSWGLGLGPPRASSVLLALPVHYPPVRAPVQGPWGNTREQGVNKRQQQSLPQLEATLMSLVSSQFGTCDKCGPEFSFVDRQAFTCL